MGNGKAMLRQRLSQAVSKRTRATRSDSFLGGHCPLVGRDHGRPAPPPFSAYLRDHPGLNSLSPARDTEPHSQWTPAVQASLLGLNILETPREVRKHLPHSKYQKLCMHCI